MRPQFLREKLKAMFLRVIETFIEWSLGIGELFKTCRCFTKCVGTLFQPIDGIGGRLYLLTHRPPFRTRLSHIPNS
jgi:hypothetical protein